MPKRKHKFKLIVNALPLTYIRTGIGRYLKCLYSALDRICRDELEIGYFDGSCVRNSPPTGLSDLRRWHSMADLFWKLPPYAAVCLRMVTQVYRELLFFKAAHGYDLYHEAGFFPFLAPSHIKTVFTIHDLSLIHFPEFHPRERVFFSRLFFHRRARRSSHFLAVSDFVGRDLQGALGLAKDQITVTPLAHDPAVFYRRKSGEVVRTRSRFTLPEKYFIFVGTGDPRKNFQVIPQALKQAALDIPLVVVGWSGWDQTKFCKSETIPLGYVTDEELARLYSGALALVFPSLYEGFGLPVLEAMACDCPVLCSSRASLPEVAGDAAHYLENPLDGKELASLLAEVASNQRLRRQLAEKGRIQAARFSWEKTAELTREVFRSLL